MIRPSAAAATCHQSPSRPPRDAGGVTSIPRRTNCDSSRDWLQKPPQLRSVGQIDDHAKQQAGDRLEPLVVDLLGIVARPVSSRPCRAGVQHDYRDAAGEERVVIAVALDVPVEVERQGTVVGAADQFAKAARGAP